MTIKVLVVDDERLVRTGFRVILDSQPDITVVGEALAIAEGADIIRVHDVREGVRVAALCDAVLRDPLTER